MFLNFYGLREQPFGVTPDPAYLYLSRTHAEALAALLCGIKTDRGFMALIAEPGMGKTTLLYQVMETIRDSARTAFIFQSQCDSREFFCYLLNELGVDSVGMDLVSMHKKLNEILFSEMLAGRRFVVIVDEAQNLSGSVLETIRLLSDFETTHAKLLEIVLAGQPPLAEKLEQPGLSQLRQRISILSHLEPLTVDETAFYIEHRLRVAGYTGDPLFAPDALASIAEQSRGIPREINNICFQALLLGNFRGCHTISGEIAREAKGYQTINREFAQEILAKMTAETILIASRTEETSATMEPDRSQSPAPAASDPVSAVSTEIDNLIARRAFELFEASSFTHGHAREDWLRAQSEILLNVPVDVTITETDLVVRADVPGFSATDLKVHVAPRSLCIAGTRQKSSELEGVTFYSERSATTIFRVLSLLEEIDPQHVIVTVSDGVLEIKLWKVGSGTKVPVLAKAAAA